MNVAEYTNMPEISLYSLFCSVVEKLKKKNVQIQSIFYVCEKFGATASSQRLLVAVEGSTGMSGDGIMSPDAKPKTEVKDDGGPANEPHKPKVTP